MRKHKDRSFVKGQTYGYLTVIEPNEILNGKQKVLVKCRCGTEKYVQLNNLLATGSNRVFSCGCMKRELISKHKTIHGMRGTMGIYNIFRNMCYRCNNKKGKDYKNYGGRGIKVLWKDFIEFYNDMSESYYKHCEEYGVNNTTIDRINNNGDYCKDNCRRVTMKEQCNNRRSNHKILYEGKEYGITELSKIIGIDRSIISRELKKGLSIYDIVNKIRTGKTRGYVIGG